jgi:type I restriction enzyme S subunit
MSYATKWPVAPLIELLNSPLLNGHHQKGMKFGSGFKIVRMVDLYRASIVNEESLDRVQYLKTPDDGYSLATGDILINRTSLKREGVAKAVLIENVSEPTFFDCSIIRARPNNAAVDSDYLLRALNGPAVRPQIMRIAKTATITTVSQPGIRSLQIPLPPLAEQKKIAGILDAADALRSKRHESLARLDTLLQSTFLDMFGDPVSNPMGWEVRELAELIQPDRPITYGILKPGPDVEGGVPYVRVTDIKNEQVLTKQLRRAAQEIESQYKRSRLITGDLLMSIRGHVGRMAIVPSAGSGANITQDTARLALFFADPAYVMRCLSTPSMQQHMARRTKGAAVKGINLGDVKKIPIPSPPLDLQHRFAAIVESVEQQKASQRAHLDELDTLFASLQSRAFRGDL